jgi:hypothetical protein
LDDVGNEKLQGIGTDMRNVERMLKAMIKALENGHLDP